MSGKLKSWSVIKSLSTVKKYLFQTNDGDSETDAGYNWDSDWGWEDVDIDDEDSECDVSSWLNETSISISSTGEIMAFAKDKRMVILAYSYEDDSENSMPSMKVNFCGEPAHMYDDDTITSVLCVPLNSLRQSNHGAPDWTCVIVGFASGFVRFYSQNGGEILSQRLHNTPVDRFRLRTYEPSRHSNSPEQAEELTVLFGDVLVCVEGFSLYQSLRACRSHLAKASAGNSTGVESPPLSFKKWALKQQEAVFDHASLGLRTPTSFDHLVTASLLGGPYAHYQPAPPTHCVYAAVGRRPFLGFYYASEGGWQPLLTDVARLVATKVKTAIFSAAASWLGGRTSTTQVSAMDDTDKIESSTALSVRYGLPDKRREAVVMEVAPDRRLCAVVDTFGRVLLVDLLRGITLRMWKGYRDGQVAWIECEEDAGRRKSVPRRAMFLVIYAPRRGILEVWAAEQGPRVAAFNVGKGGQLLAVDFKMLGLNGTTYHSLMNHRKAQPLFSLFFLDREGNLSTLEVPFHLCLTDRSSNRAHDYHLLKQLRLLMREKSCATPDDVLLELIFEIFNEFRLVGFLEQGVERILNTKYLTPFVLEQIFREVIQKLETGDLCKMSPRNDKERLIVYGRTVLNLIKTYTSIRNLSFPDERDDDDDVMRPSCHLNRRVIESVISPHLPECWGERIGRLSKVLDYNHVIGESSNTVNRRPSVPSTSLTVIQFLAMFYSHFHGRKENSGLQCDLRLSSQIDDEHGVKLGQFLFQSYLAGFTTADDLISVMNESCIPRDVYLTAFVTFFLSEDRFNVNHVDAVASMLQQLIHFKALESFATPVEICDIVERIEKDISVDKSLGPPLFMTMAVVSVLQSEIKTRDKIDPEGAERLAEVLPQWLHLSRRAEDMLALQLLLVHRPVDEDPLPGASDICSLPSSATGAGATATETLPDLSVSQKRLSEGGRGFVTELLARWTTRWRLTLADIQCLYYSLAEQQAEHREKTEEDMDVEEAEGNLAAAALHRRASPSTQELFAALFDHFPMALEMDSLLANVAWEYIFIWSKDPEETCLLGTAVDCLRHIGPGGALVCHGVASMAWHMHLEKYLQCATYLIEKVGGKAPKDRMCRKETNMSQQCMRQFIHMMFEFMEIFKQANCDADVVPAFMMDESWRTIVDGRLSLVELAIDQPITNYGLLAHHAHLIFCLDAVMTFDIRGIKPYTLFDTRGVNAFFKSLTSHPLLPSGTLDAQIVNQRTIFINRVLESAVRLLKERGDETSHNFFRDLIVNKLSPSFVVDADVVRRQHIVYLYSFGLDQRAETYLPTVHDLTVLASQLLLVVGQRCAHMIFPVNEQANLKRMGLMPPVLESYFKTSNYEEMPCTNAPVESTKRLIDCVIKLMVDDHPELHRARLVSDLLERFINFGEEV